MIERRTKREGKHAYFSRCFEDAVELEQMAPVKIGDSVYIIMEDEDVGDGYLVHQTVNGVGRDCLFLCANSHEDGSSGNMVYFDEIGEDLLLELGEARAELARRRKCRKGTKK